MRIAISKRRRFFSLGGLSDSRSAFFIGTPAVRALGPSAVFLEVTNGESN